ncbi:hypothetical protein [Flavobacterium aquicola]|nr:hypothetical protein [Flavobacterium aquicola]
MENEDLKKAFDFDLNIDFNERKYSKEVLKFVKNYSKKSGLEKLDFIEKGSKNYNPERFFNLINEIEHAFKKVEKKIDLQDRELNKSQEYGEKQIQERGKIQKNRDALKQAKDSWKINLNEYFKRFHSQKSFQLTVSTNDNPIEKPNKDKTKENWFIIGVKFATGEMQQMLKENTPPDVAEILGNKKGFRPYITSTLGTKKESLKYKDKNIYTRKKTDIELILDYCKKNNLIVCQEFKDEIKHIITD